MGPLTGIIPGKRVHLSEGQIVAVDYAPGFGPIPSKVARPALPAPTLERPHGLNRQQRRAARKKKR